MKSTIKTALAAIITLFATQVYSQGMYVNLGIGYGIPAAPNIVSATDEIKNFNGTSIYYSYKRISGTGSFGKGLQFGGTFGYMLNENIGFEMGVAYLKCSEVKSSYSSTGPLYSDRDESTISGKMIRFIPAVKMTLGKNNTKPYLRTGLVLGVGAKLKNSEKSSETQNYTGATTNTLMESELTGNISLGFAGALGLDFKLSDKVGLFAEVNILTQSWAPKKQVLTKYTEDGVDQLPSMTTEEKETEFVDTYIVTNTTTNNKQLKVFMPFSSVGINAGLRLAIGGQK